MHELELYHHGILGQKWGVRRFQNADGTRTKAGKKRYGSDKNDSDSIVLKKGSRTYRVANEGEDISKGRYMSVTKGDREVYTGDMLKGLFVDWNKPVVEYTNTLNKDVTVKKGEAVVHDLILKYGDKDVNSLLEDLDVEKSFRSEQSNKDRRSAYLDLLDDTDDDFDWDTFDKRSSSHERLDDFVWDVMKKNGDMVVDDYKKQGYDAIVDPYDFIANIADMPIIMIDPKSSITRKKARKVQR